MKIAIMPGAIAMATLMLAAGPASASPPTGCTVTGAGVPVSCVAMPPATVPTVGQQIMDGQGNPGTPWMVTDWHGAPMAWVNIYGFYSGGAPGFPGGLICTTKVLQDAACLTPDTGTLELFDSTGRNPVKLTRADILFLHKLERKARRKGG